MQVPSPKLLTLIGLQPTGDLGPLTAYTSARAKPVWFAKTNPLSPPSIMQTRMRNFFRLSAFAWRSLSQPQRQAWSRAAITARLRITGYNLFVWYQRTADAAPIRTIERLSGESLI